MPKLARLSRFPPTSISRFRTTRGTMNGEAIISNPIILKERPGRSCATCRQCSRDSSHQARTPRLPASNRRRILLPTRLRRSRSPRSMRRIRARRASAVLSHLSVRRSARRWGARSRPCCPAFRSSPPTTRPRRCARSRSVPPHAAAGSMVLPSSQPIGRRMPSLPPRSERPKRRRSRTHRASRRSNRNRCR